MQETIVAIKKILDGIEHLKEIYGDTGRKFSMDGRMVGDIGEVIAANVYDIKLTKGIEKGHDALWGNKKVQIKATYGNGSLGFSKQYKDMYYIGLQLFKEPDTNGRIYKEIYNGAGAAIYNYLCENKQGLKKIEDLEKGTLISITLSDLMKVPKQQSDRVAER